MVLVVSEGVEVFGSEIGAAIYALLTKKLFMV